MARENEGDILKEHKLSNSTVGGTIKKTSDQGKGRDNDSDRGESRGERNI
jgi:hypothetical protein